MMKKYLYSFKLNFLNSFHYRFNTLVSMVFGNLRLLIIIFFWYLIYEGDAHKTLNGFTLYGIVTYLVIGDVFGTVVFNLRSSGFDYTGMIKSGSLGPALLRPLSLSTSIYFRNLSGGVAGMLPQALLVVCAMPFAVKLLNWNTGMINATGAVNAVSIVIFLLVGTVSSHLMCSLLGYMAFWLEEANAVMWSFAVILNFVMGFFIPLDFFPKWSVRILELLPFSSWCYIPAKIFIGHYPLNRQAHLLVFQVAWIGALLLLNLCIWKKGLKKFSAVGG